MKLKQIKKDIPDLPEAMRAEIADFVLETLNKPDPEIEQAWAKEARRRLDELERGEAKTIPGEQVHQELRDKTRQGVEDPEEEIVSGPPMGPKITSVEPLDDFFLHLTFENGEVRKIDMKPFRIGVFTPLKEPDYFKRVRIVDGSLAWPDDQDLHHDMLYKNSEPVDQ